MLNNFETEHNEIEEKDTNSKKNFFQSTFFFVILVILFYIGFFWLLMFLLAKNAIIGLVIEAVCTIFAWNTGFGKSIKAENFGVQPGDFDIGLGIYLAVKICLCAMAGMVVTPFMLAKLVSMLFRK